MPEIAIAITDRENLSDKVFQQIKQAIISGELAQGSKLTEDDLAKQYGVSRGPLREAIRQLESFQLIERVPRAGMRVVTLTTQLMKDLYSVREVLEGMSARQAALHMSQSEISSLFALLDEHEDHISQHHGKQYLQQEGDLDFHFRISQASRNQWLIELLSSKIYQLLKLCRHRSSQTPDRPRQALLEHRRIVEAIANHDAELAEMLMRRHISGAWKIVEPLLLADEQNQNIK